MARKPQLFIFVEGRSDTRFVRGVVFPRLKPHYEHTDIIEYASMRASKFTKWLQTARRMGADVLLMHDFDLGPNYTTVLRTLRQRYRGIKTREMYIVRIEIESWYLAGLSESNRKRFKLQPLTNTETINKEAFLRMRPKGKGFRSPSNFMIELLKNYNVRAARKRNASFAYFFGRVIALTARN